MYKRVAIVSVVALAAVMLAGCDGAPAAGPSASTTAAPTPAQTTAATAEDAIAAANGTAEEFFRIWDEATLSEDPADISLLDEVARDAAIETVQNIQDEQVKAGYIVVEGGTKWTLLPGQSSASPATFQGEQVPFGAVTLFGCADYSDTVGYDSAGEEVPPLGPWKDRLTVAYWPDEERWYVTDFDTLQEESDECAGTSSH